MNLKYYLRGLGIGILVTALIMGVSARSHPNTMSESEIRAEAQKLGMVDGKSVLKENEVKTNEKTEQSVSSNTASNTKQASGNDLDSEEQQNTDKKNTEKNTDENDDDSQKDEIETEENSGMAGIEDETEMDSENKTTETASDEQGEKTESTTTKTATITVNSGDGSHTVARKLEDAGIVESALEYDRFLCQNGYEKKLRVGSFEISVDASYEEIAKILTGR